MITVGLFMVWDMQSTLYPTQEVEVLQEHIAKLAQEKGKEKE